MEKVKPKKALGQHFLTDESVAARIAATIDCSPQLPVVEVGPGMGMLTKYLLQAGRDVTVVELDTESVDYLEQNYPALSGHIVSGDFLRLDLTEFADADGHLCVIGNYPYNISSQIFFHVLEYKDAVTLCSGMLQREVAERIAAPEGSRTRGILSVLLQAWYDVEYLFTVSEGVFNPPPKVKSGVIRLQRNSVTDLGCDERLFKTVVKTTFGQRRKTIRNSLKSLLPAGAQLPEHELLGKRPEQLSVAQFIELTNLVSSLRK
ncbi:MAG: 16S rRNA (adenine(1518)-N(6)/adenine(1519)-N(6))-dimethyltransferase RsmA [Bacteroidales bacterium]|nr:16S rRNA (adenine(1518)-N(6)/adenine(1519)-N(6))-dimethyltransferase RsmA [Bacteroidales bacterium]MBD5234968.1 16S rRNA (adenine(1518)-N(6)/adenine(1519)-N(6))-dimethyltransferase RsmA [Barnesiella sp.]MBD5246659.1 16S rRNA (adenine(1518)-N(6)/adenine(1519)-N(6))-dimethyltransferase RsmA [Barnesiella sp.]MBD5257747.1 16S rRNA (adenine(1518)-N(6)/adenine(1519)-N(6))-dimethyltransferase RsmA [Barnesiella sp.]